MNKSVLVFAVAVTLATVGLVQAAPLNPITGQQTVAQLSAAQRSAIVVQIVRKWRPYIQKVQKANIGAWTNRMGATFAAANDANLQRAASMTTFQGMMDALLGQQMSEARIMDSLATQAQVLGSSPHQALLGSTATDLVYTPLAPCRIADTRNLGGPITGGLSRDFRGYTATNFGFQGGDATTNCGIPANPSALMINVAAPVSSQSGYLTVWPFGTTRPLASNLDYKAGDLANNEMAAKMTIGSATAEFSVYAFGSTNVVIDVVGYFMAPQATALDILSPPRSSTINVGPNSFGSIALVCPVGYSMTGGGCSSGGTAMMIEINGIFNNEYECRFFNQATITLVGMGSVQCARIPGR